MRILVLAACLLGMLGTPSRMAFAQAGSGSVEGVVTNSSGAPVPNATVELTDVNTGQKATVKTDSRGHYRFDNVTIGRHTIRIVSNTPNAFRSQDVEVGSTGTTLNLTWSNRADGTPQTDNAITAETVPLQTDPAQLKEEWNTQAVQYKPESNLVNRSGSAFGGYNLTVTSEAVATQGGPARGLAVAGNRPESNNFRLDGIDNNNKASPGPLVYLPNEATQNTSLMQAQAQPVFGHSTGGKFNSIMRTGANDFHGAVYNYLQNRLLNAMEPAWGSRLGLKDSPRYDQNRLGAALSFPILPSKLFFFGNFEYIPLGFQAPVAGNAMAPTVAGFAALSRIPGVSATNLGILRSALGALPSNAASTTRVGGVSVPLGTITAFDRGFQNQWIGAGGVDWNIAAADALHLRYMHNESDARSAGVSLPAFNTPLATRALVASAAHNHTFSGNTTNELRLGYNRWDHHFDQGRNAATFPGLTGFPNIQIGGVNNFALGPNFGQRDFSVYNTYHMADAVAFHAWGHNFKAGGDAMRTISSLGPLASTRGTYIYSSLDRFLLDLPPDVFAQRSFGSSTLNDNRWLATGFLQDNWNARPGLSVNWGVRYQWAALPAFIDQQGLLAGTNVNLPGQRFDFRIPPSDKDNWSGNLGFAWSPGQSRRTVLRAGFNMMYDLLNNPWLNFGAFAPQVGTTITSTGVSDTPGFLRGGGIANPFPASGDLTETQQRSLLSAFAGDFVTPYSMQWNAGIQQTLWRNTSVNVKYLGNRSVHIPVLSFANIASPVTAAQSLPVFTQAPAQAQLNALPLTLNRLQAMPVSTLAAQGVTNPIFTLAPDGNSMYHALAVDVNQRLGSLQLLGSYTWSHLIDDSTGTPIDLVFGRQRTDSLYDRRHRATVTGVFDVAPLFGNSNSWVRDIVADLSISGTYLYQSAARVPVFSNTNANFTGFGFATPAVMNPNAAGNLSTTVTPLRNSAGQTVGYLANNPNARFIQAAPGVFAPGIRNAFALDPVNNIDLSVVKRFSYRERFSFEVRGDAYNLINRSQYTGVPINSFDIRSLSFAPSFLVAGNPNFGDPTGFLTANPRTIQLALRATF